jgi:glycosyltransferase involved in cell wall biosynthesis
LLYHRPNTIVAAPLFSGTGQRVKLLEAFATASPVITTTVGAAGFPLKPRVEALIADTRDAWVQGLGELIASEDLRYRLGDHARSMIEREFDWNKIGTQLLDAVNK